MLHTGMLKIIDSQDTPIVPGEVISAEGMPLVRELVNGREHVRVGSSVKAPFMGISYSESLTPLVKSKVERVMANPDTGKFCLIHEPITGQVSFYDEAGAVITDATVTGREVTAESQKGKYVRVQYRYQPTTYEVITEDRILVPSMSASDMTGTIGVILQGVVYTDMFEASADFSAPDIELAVSENGLVTVQDEEKTLAPIPGTVVAVPGIETPFLGIRFGY